MLRQRLTFGEAIAGLDLMPRTRIKRIRDELWARLDALPRVRIRPSPGPPPRREQPG
jgi:hypothetical protein